MSVTIKYLKKSIKAEKAAYKDYMKHAKGKDGKFLKEIAHDELDHRRKEERRLKKLEAAEKKSK